MRWSICWRGWTCPATPPPSAGSMLTPKRRSPFSISHSLNKRIALAHEAGRTRFLAEGTTFASLPHRALCSCERIAMSNLTFTLLVGLGSLGAGFLGALTGLGGGVVLVPLLALGFGVDLRYAVGASLVSVIATSSGAAAAYVKEGYSNIRIGMFLEVA